MPPVLLKSSRFSPQPHWKIATSMPYAAATERRLSTIALSAITIDRNATRSSRNANRRTKPNTSGADDFIIELKSKDFAVAPPTAYSTPGTVPIVAGTSSFRSVASAWFETSSAPLPASGIATSNVFPSGLVSTWIGFCISPEASALAFRSAIAALTCVGVSTRDRDIGGAGATRERVVDHVERGQLRLALRQRVEPAVGRVQVQRRQREHEEQRRRRDGRRSPGGEGRA